ncbi:MAG: hypothetical protein Ct9H90mP6_07990 [Gammaproteobacteria bacterium]|nr:MAG: hypothetical protein Ct9H90mP6_07990 [Gammaproteobacteria bacterium]
MAQFIQNVPEKAASFIQLCNKRDIPLIFLQNVTGFLVGKDFERQAIIKKGSQMINAVSNSTVPHITIIVGAFPMVQELMQCLEEHTTIVLPFCGRLQKLL